jgi:LysR family glycine cleavage system transcriptional activator
MKTTKAASFDLRQLPLNALMAFEAAGRYCHLRQAAEEMCVSHSSLSRYIKQLESRLDIQLFERHKNKLHLTPPGSRLLLSIQTAFAELNRGIHSLDPTLIAGEVIIGTTATIMLNWLLPVLAKVQKKYPEISFTLKTIEPQQHSLPNELDIALCLGFPKDTTRHVVKLYDEHYVPVCNPSLLSGKPVKKIQQLLKYPVLHDSLGQWYKWFEFHKLNVQGAPQHTHFDYAYQAIEAARLGMGIVLADTVEVAEDISQGKLMQAIDSAHTEGQSVYLATLEHSQMNYRSRLVLNSILENLEQKGANLAQQLLS